MGQIHLFTPEQQQILNKISQNDFLRSQFYFTGGTALSYIYLQHRHSEDLDLFSEQPFESSFIQSLIDIWKNELDFSYDLRTNEVVHIYQMKFENNTNLKVDFAFYPYKRLKEGRLYNGMIVDSFTDIAINKLATINQRTQVKDFVDLYFILKTQSIWDLMLGVEVKFKRKLDSLIIAQDFLKVEDFDKLPKMILPLSLDELKDFFRDQAKKVAQTVVE